MSESAAPRGPGAVRPSRTPAHRRRQRIFLVIWAGTFLGSIWPIHPLFSKPFPLIVGLPFSLAWILLLLGVQFFALLWLFLNEPPEAES